jgi:hypothetical protein
MSEEEQEQPITEENAANYELIDCMINTILSESTEMG